ncbi:expressed protein [Batrachochytrium dendrobatidis JAM81]|uniref:Expressed protein n=2 Tax=Batrachochytrium dendrobatidis (strain JAM81 / FGSC 10211) TaxID=684364 RepID=F4P459_BATDJ|nr:uncharacterized protein BATDEDRAFT_37039 [Batrachochytrium dendrobatidis JAM81]EGF79731.1 expressed protein [Batrachochytrium dendrobatidis JAM81]|eukprot:XP_006679601.1 expressed protein [Batrachochytrium dendrobatidis JAM81]
MIWPLILWIATAPSLVIAGVCSVTDRLCIDQKNIVLGQSFPIWYAINQIPTFLDQTQLILTMFTGNMQQVADPCNIAFPVVMTFGSPLTLGAVDSLGYAGSFIVDIPNNAQIQSIQAARNQFFFQLRDSLSRVCLTGPYQDGGTFTWATLSIPPTTPSPTSGSSGTSGTSGSTNPNSSTDHSPSNGNNNHANPPNEPNNGNTESNSTSSGLIGGIVAAVVLVAVCIAVFIFYRRKRAANQLLYGECGEGLTPLALRRHSSFSLLSSKSLESATIVQPNLLMSGIRTEKTSTTSLVGPISSISDSSSSNMQGHVLPQPAMYIMNSSKKADTLRPGLIPTLASQQSALGLSVGSFGTSPKSFASLTHDPSHPIYQTQSLSKLVVPSHHAKSASSTGTLNVPLASAEDFNLSATSGFSLQDARLIADAFRQELADPSHDWEARSETSSPSRPSDDDIQYADVDDENPFGTGSRPTKRDDNA